MKKARVYIQWMLLGIVAGLVWLVLRKRAGGAEGFSAAGGSGGSNNLKRMPTYVPRKREPPAGSNIPYSVYMCWISRDSDGDSVDMPEGLYNAITRTIELSPEFDFHIYDLKHCRKFIAEHFDKSVLDAFDRLKPNSYKSDLWRFCTMYAAGGIYIDSKFEAKAPLKELLRYNDTTLVLDSENPNLAVGTIIAKKGDPIFKMCIDQIVKHVHTNYYGDSPLDPTGPNLAYKIFQREGRLEDAHLTNRRTPIPKNPYIYEIMWRDQPDKVLLKEYDDYRIEQKREQERMALPYYADLWKARNIYN